MNTEIIVKDLEIVNFAKVKEELSSILDNYKSHEVTLDNYQESKNIRATLNKSKKAINDIKISTKKEFIKPYTEFEDKCKELMSDIETVSSEIDIQVKGFDEAFKQARREYIFNLCNEYLDNEFDLEAFIDDKWLNKSMSDKKVEKELVERVEVIKKDIESLKTLNSEFEFEIIQHYKKNLNVGEAIVENNNLMQTKQRKEALARQQEEERKEAEEEMRAVGCLQKNETITTDGEIDKLHTFKFSIYTTIAKKDMLKAYMKANNIDFGAV